MESDWIHRDSNHHPRGPSEFCCLNLEQPGPSPELPQMFFISAWLIREREQMARSLRKPQLDLKVRFISPHYSCRLTCRDALTLSKLQSASHKEMIKNWTLSPFILHLIIWSIKSLKAFQLVQNTTEYRCFITVNLFTQTSWEIYKASTFALFSPASHDFLLNKFNFKFSYALLPIIC